METIGLTDDKLLYRFRSGDHTAFDQFYAQCWKPLYRTAFKILKDEAASEDVVQETFIRLWENREKINHDNIPGWLSTTSYRLVLKTLQQQKKYVSFENSIFQEPLATTADQPLQLHQLKLQIATTVDRLPDQCQKVYKLSREEHLSVKSIAHKLGISPKTVEAHVTAAMKKIRRGISFLSLILL